MELKQRRSPMKTRNNNNSNTQHRQQQQQQGSNSEITSTTRFRIGTKNNEPPSLPWWSNNNNNKDGNDDNDEHNDTLNYALLVVLYTLQGIPMGLSASIPFLIQQKAKQLAVEAAAAAAAASTTAVGGAATVAAAAAASSSSTTAAAAAGAAAAKLSYNANAIFALCSWPFSLKLLWAPIVDACFIRQFGRRKSWLVPVQAMAGALMVFGSNFVERQFEPSQHGQLNVKGITAFFFALYFLMATQDIAVDGWALTMLSKKNRGRGPVCNSIGQNLGYFLSFVGFLALNDAESSEKIWRPLFRLPPSLSDPPKGVVSLGGFVRFMGYFMLITTTVVALFKHEYSSTPSGSNSLSKDDSDRPQLPVALLSSDRMNGGESQQHTDEEITDHELDASEIGLKETYHRLWAVCKLPAVRSLFLILLTYRLPTALTDNVKFLKAVELGLSKSTTALLSPTVILPIGIFVPIIATKVWKSVPLTQFMFSYRFRVTLVPLLDLLMLTAIKVTHSSQPHSSGLTLLFWTILVLSTAAQAITNTLQFNAQMTFFAHRVDPAIGGSYMTLLNTAANLGGTWPSSFVMWLVSRLTPVASGGAATGQQEHAAGIAASRGIFRDPYFGLQSVFCCLGLLWIFVFGKRVTHVAQLPDDAWRTHLLDSDEDNKKEDGVYSRSNTGSSGGVVSSASVSAVDLELGGGTGGALWSRAGGKRE